MCKAGSRAVQHGRSPLPQRPQCRSPHPAAAPAARRGRCPEVAPAPPPPRRLAAASWRGGGVRARPRLAPRPTSHTLRRRAGARLVRPLVSACWIVGCCCSALARPPYTCKPAPPQKPHLRPMLVQSNDAAGCHEPHGRYSARRKHLAPCPRFAHFVDSCEGSNFLPHLF